MQECKKSQIQQFFPNSRANNSGLTVSICPKIELVRDIMGIYIAATFGNDWSILADASVLTKSNMAKFRIQEQITRTVLLRLNP